MQPAVTPQPKAIRICLTDQTEQVFQYYLLWYLFHEVLNDCWLLKILHFSCLLRKVFLFQQSYCKMFVVKCREQISLHYYYSSLLLNHWESGCERDRIMYKYFNHFLLKFFLYRITKCKLFFFFFVHFHLNNVFIFTQHTSTHTP